MKHEYISYPGYGIGRIIGTETKLDVEFIRIHMLTNDLSILIPKASTNVYRPLMNRETALQVIHLMNSSTKKAKLTGMASFRLWTKKIQSNDPILIAEVVAELNGKENLNFGERKLLDVASGLLEMELLLIDELPRQHG